LLDQLPCFGQKAELRLALVEIKSDIVHGWPPGSLLRHRPRVSLWGEGCHHAAVEASHFIPTELQSVRETREDLAMTFNPAIWRPIAVVLSVINVVGAGFAARSAEPWHATVHAALALAFGLWAQRLRQGPAGSEGQARLEVLEAEVSNLRQELSETQERLDFAERLLAQEPEARRVSPER
jgi:hypothetical protein